MKHSTLADISNTISNKINLIPISELFDVKYGVNLELINLEQCNSMDVNSIPFVSRKDGNNGVSAFVKRITTIIPNNAHTISVAGGGSVLSSYYQPLPYYSSFHIFILTPKRPMTDIEMLFFTKCISQNKYKYSYGRQANKTLKNILIPRAIPKALLDKLIAYKKITFTKINTKPLINKKYNLDINNWQSFRLTDIFNIIRGKRLTQFDRIEGNTPLVTASSINNGVVSFIDHNYFKNIMLINENAITIDMFFNCFYHNYQYFNDDNVHTFKLKYIHANSYIYLFMVTILKKNAYRYSYGRCLRLKRLHEELIMLPTKNNVPDWQFMENYIKSLNYSSIINNNKWDQVHE